MPRGGSAKPGRQVDGVHSHAWLHAPVAKQVVLATRAQREAELPKLGGPFKQEPGCSADGMPLRTHAQVPSRTYASAAASVWRVEAFRPRLLDVRRVDLRGGVREGCCSPILIYVPEGTSPWRCSESSVGTRVPCCWTNPPGQTVVGAGLPAVTAS